MREESNRAFTFLVEAGEKIPAKNTGGNEMSIFKPKSKRAVLGNISRCLRLSLAFSEMMRPFLIIESFEVND